MTASAVSIGAHLVSLGEEFAVLRELRGADERAVSGATSRDAIALLDRLLTPAVGAVAGPGEARRLTIAERDRLLAEIYLQTFGARIQGTAQCRACDERYDLDFNLRDLLPSHLQRQVVLPGGATIRAPTGEDELAVEGLPADAAPQALFERITESDENTTGDLDIAAGALAKAAPVIDLDAHAVCPECEADNTIHFAIQDYLLNALVNERRRLLREVHILARGYGWDLATILSLCRAERRTFVALLDAEWGAR
ncbi:MAG: hypothetical protein AAF449_25215 [Myxococcota bacterium]